MNLMRITITILLLSNINCASIQANRNISFDNSNYFIKTVLQGSEVPNGDPGWRHSVLIKFQDGYCSGTIISKDTIVSAAHCVKKHQIATIYFGVHSDEANKVKHFHDRREVVKIVTVGERFKNSISATNSSDSFLNFNQYSYKRFKEKIKDLKALNIKNNYDFHFTKRSQDDLALLFFKGGVPSGFEPVQFLSSNYPAFKDKVFTFGYGIEARAMDQSIVLLRQGITYAYQYYSSGKKKLFLTTYSDSHSENNPCFGDSGGGSFVKNKEGDYRFIGIYINTDNNCAESFGHLLVYPHGHWINSEIVKFREEPI